MSERARELEADNKDRQREREEIEELKLRMLAGGSANITPSSSGTPNRLLLDKYKKPLLDLTNSTTPPSATQLITGFKSDPIKIPIASRLQALANSQPPKEKEQHNHVKLNNKDKEPSQKLEKLEIVASPSPNSVQNQTIAQPTSFSGIQLNSFVPVNKTPSNHSTPNSMVSPLPITDASPSPNSKSGSGFQMTIANSSAPNSNSAVKRDDEDSRQSFSSAPSPGMPTPQGNINITRTS